MQDGRDSAVPATESRSPGADSCGDHEGLQGKVVVHPGQSDLFNSTSLTIELRPTLVNIG